MGIEMDFEAELENALGSNTPLLTLRSFLQELLARGESRESLIEKLTKFREKLLLSGREKDDDLILELMDLLYGWCSPEMKL
jgi:hypothetical protein